MQALKQVSRDVTETPQRKGNPASGLIAVTGCLLLLGATVALPFTVADWWRERGQATWPQTRAVLDERDVANEESRASNTVWILRCRVHFDAGGRTFRSEIHSRGSREPAQLARMRDWAAAHEASGEIAIRYDPADPAHTIFDSADVPLGGPRSPGDASIVTLLGGVGLAALVLATALKAWGL
jgi:hypothetical protein